MNVDASILGQQFPHQHKAFIDHGYEGVGTFAPGVPVGNFLQNVGLLRERVAANLDVHGEIRAHVKGRINVDQLEAALLLDFFAQRAVLEGGEDELVVAPDQLVRPTLQLASALVRGEDVHLPGGVGGLLGAGFIHLLNDLKGQDDVADLAGLAIPDQFHLPLVVKKQKALLVR